MALDEVTAWRREREAEIERRLDELRAEEVRLRNQIVALEKQIETVRERARALGEEQAEHDMEEARRKRDAFLEGLAADRRLVEERIHLHRQALADREDRARALAEQPEMARLLQEFKRFREVEPTLVALPAGYRKAILDYHEGVRRRLKPLMHALEQRPDPVARDRAAVAVVASVEPSEGPPDALVVIVPVPFAVYEDWPECGDELGALIAYRVIGAVSGALAAVGAPDAQVLYASYEGCLSIQVWLADSAVEGDLKDALTARIDQVREVADELACARIELDAVWLAPEVVAPDDADESVDDAPEGETPSTEGS